MMRLKRSARVALIAWLAACCALTSLAAAVEPVNFSREILPILSDKCFHCHGTDDKTRGGDLRLDDETAAKRNRDGSAAIVPGQSTMSELVRRITSTDADERMPPPKSNRSLSAEQIALLKRWIDEGAKWGKHWAFEAPVRPQLPVVKNTAWPQNPLDNFILARLDREQLTPSPAASVETLIRRLYLDLTGLPPTVEELDGWVTKLKAESRKLGENASSRDSAAFSSQLSALVDSLLASPRYGERWAWDWLDAARYADSNGYQGDPERTMWPWRDWVVSAINRNQSYDRFTIEQLAGDLLPNASLDQKIATGFNRNHMFNGEGGRIAEETRVENVMDRLETTATVWMGVTLGCARCHDHKYDPFTNREYYEFFAYFNNTSETGGASGGGRSGQIAPIVAVMPPEVQLKLDQLQRDVDTLGKQVNEREKTVFARGDKLLITDAPLVKELPEKAKAAIARAPHDRPSDARNELATFFKDRDPEYAKLLGALNGAISRRDSLNSSYPRVMVMDEQPQVRDTFMLVKGLYNKTTDKVTANVPRVFPKPPADKSTNRLGLAEWLMDRRHPLTARVTVNRYWQAFFGVGLVKTVEDFGVQGESPSHPELLDWLATELVDSGWNIKHLHRLIVTSAAYQQSSSVTPTLWERDPENRLLARGPRFRMPSWMIRDQALAISGLLVDRLGGPSVKPYQPAGIWEEATFGKKTYVQDHGESLYRRSLYIFWRRIVGPTMFFDTSTRQVCSIKQVRTNTPLHALATLNDVTYIEAARTLAQRVLQTSPSADDSSRIAAAFRRATTRAPSSQELTVLQGTLDRLRKHYAADRDAALQLLKTGESPRDEQLDPIEHASFTALCTLILNLDEVLTKQ
ncbi:MAG: PSD1 domain-containing protein [Planctomycetaceae bacterium]|nr:PSD1 domain-containing protein [Planctomycetaceae bacterium]